MFIFAAVRTDFVSFEEDESFLDVVLAEFFVFEDESLAVAGFFSQTASNVSLI